jgi:hypothetical protein
MLARYLLSFVFKEYKKSENTAFSIRGRNSIYLVEKDIS